MKNRRLNFVAFIGLLGLVAAHISTGSAGAVLRRQNAARAYRVGSGRRHRYGGSPRRALFTEISAGQSQNSYPEHGRRRWHHCQQLLRQRSQTGRSDSHARFVFQRGELRAWRSCDQIRSQKISRHRRGRPAGKSADDPKRSPRQIDEQSRQASRGR